MKLVFGFVVMLTMLAGPGDIARINALKAEAKKAFQAGDFKTAIAKYKFLVDSLGVKEDEVLMNLSNSYFRTNDTTNAVSSYQPLLASKDTKIKSIANQQLGVLSNRAGKPEEALNYFKQALKTAPDNNAARYNYEMVKKKLEEKKKEDEKNKDKNKDQNKDQNKDKKDEQNKDKEKKEQEKKEQEKKDQEKKDQEKKEQDEKDKDGKKDDKSKEEKEKEEKQKKEQEEKDKKEKTDKQDPSKDKNDKKELPSDVKEKLKDMQMSEQKAKMILEAMKNQEKQYLQQNKRKATKNKDVNKPDW